MNAIDVEEFSVRAETTVQFTSHALLQQRLTRIAVNLNNYDNFPSIREKMEKFKILPEIFSIRGFTSNTVFLSPIKIHQRQQKSIDFSRFLPARSFFSALTFESISGATIITLLAS